MLPVIKGPRWVFNMLFDGPFACSIRIQAPAASRRHRNVIICYMRDKDLDNSDGWDFPRHLFTLKFYVNWRGELQL
jgi:hypothetical protein